MAGQLVVQVGLLVATVLGLVAFVRPLSAPAAALESVAWLTVVVG